LTIQIPYKTIILVVCATQIFCVNSALAAQDNVTIVPEGISNMMSDIDMNVRLAIKSNAAACLAEHCLNNQLFNDRVQHLGAQLATTAYALYPALQERVPQFTFSVIDKAELGTASNGAGKIVLFRGLQTIELDDDSLDFIIAREMGHVIAQHHNKNISTKLIISALASVLFPAVAIISASSAAAQATTATTLLTSAASTATSMVGGEVAISKMKPTQLAESDAIAVDLLNHQSWDMRSVVNILQLEDVGKTAWINDLQISTANLQTQLDVEEVLPSLEQEYLDSDYTESKSSYSQ
jgi:predicted Zn-dependent protease